jgi:hypothetical protein
LKLGNQDLHVLKKLVQTVLIKFSIEQPNFLVFTWCGEFGDRVVHPGCRETARGQPDSKDGKGVKERKDTCEFVM